MLEVRFGTPALILLPFLALLQKPNDLADPKQNEDTPKQTARAVLRRISAAIPKRRSAWKRVTMLALA